MISPRLFRLGLARQPLVMDCLEIRHLTQANYLEAVLDPSSLFGAENASAYSKLTSGGLFGSSTINAKKPAGSGLFGSSSTNAEKPSGSGLFGSSSSNAEKPTGSGLFGSSSTNAEKPVGSGLFGSSSTNAEKPTGSGLFGASSSSGSSTLFGGAASDNSKSNEKQSGGLFGSSSGSGLKSTTTSNNLFGTMAAAEEEKEESAAKRSSQSSSIFGASSSSGLFGNSSEKEQEKTASSTLFSFGNPNEQGKKSVTFDLSKNTQKEFSISSNPSLQNAPLANANPNTEETVAKMELNGLTLEKIITLWHDKLQSHLDLYGETAQKVRERDMILLENQTKITELAKEAQILKAEQNELQWNLDTVTELQRDLNSSLDQLEQELDILESNHPKVYNEEAKKKREEAYGNIALLNSRLVTSKAEIRELSEKLFAPDKSSALEEKLSEVTSGTVTKAHVLEIMSRHQMSLEWLNATTQELASELQQYK